MTEVLNHPTTFDQSLNYLLEPHDPSQISATDHAAQLIMHRSTITLATSLPDKQGGIAARTLIRGRIAGYIDAGLAAEENESDAVSAAANVLADPALSPFAAEAITQRMIAADQPEPETQLQRVWTIIRRAHQTDPTLTLPEPLVDAVMYLTIPTSEERLTGDSNTDISDSPLVNYAVTNLMELSRAEPYDDFVPEPERMQPEDGDLGVTAASSGELLRQAGRELQDYALELFTKLKVERDSYFKKVEAAAASDDGALGARFRVVHDVLMSVVGNPGQIIEGLLSDNVFESNESVHGAVHQLEVELLMNAQGSLKDMQEAAVTLRNLVYASTLGREAVQAQVEIELLNSLRSNPALLKESIESGLFSSDVGGRVARLQHDHDVIAMAGTDINRLTELVSNSLDVFYTAEMMHEAKIRHDTLLMESHKRMASLLERDLAEGLFYTQAAKNAARTAIDEATATYNALHALTVT